MLQSDMVQSLFFSGVFIIAFLLYLLLLMWWKGSRYLQTIVPSLLKIVSSLKQLTITPVLNLFRFKTIICPHCLRYTHPFHTRYHDGRRYCEHCHGRIGQTSEAGRVVVIFGTFKEQHLKQITTGNRIFCLANPDFEKKTVPIDVSTVWVEPSTSQESLLERFLAYIVNYPPEQGVQSVHIVICGNLTDLQESLKNALQNTFRHVQQIHNMGEKEVTSIHT